MHSYLVSKSYSHKILLILFLIIMLCSSDDFGQQSEGSEYKLITGSFGSCGTIEGSKSISSDYQCNGSMYGFDMVDSMNSSDYKNFPGFWNTLGGNYPSIIVLSLPTQSTDGDGKIIITVNVHDVDAEECKLKAEYSTDNTNYFKATISEDPTDITADYGSPNVDNDKEFQIGNSSGWIVTNQGSNTITFKWTSNIDLLNTEDSTVWLLLSVSDGYFSNTQHTMSFEVDNKSPIISGLAAKTGPEGSVIMQTDWQRDDDPYLYWDASESLSPIEGYSISLDLKPDSSINQSETSYQFPHDSLDNGTYTFYVKSKDKVGNWGEPDSFKIFVDIESPPAPIDIKANPSEWTSDPTPIIYDYSVIDSFSGVDFYEYYITGGVNANPSSWSYLANEGTNSQELHMNAGSGELTVHVRAVDHAGNYGSENAVQIFIHQTSPIIIVPTLSDTNTRTARTLKVKIQSSIDIKSATLFGTTTAYPSKFAVNMAKVSGDSIWKGDIPQLNNDADVEYRVKAEDIATPSNKDTSESNHYQIDTKKPDIKVLEWDDDGFGSTGYYNDPAHATEYASVLEPNSQMYIRVKVKDLRTDGADGVGADSVYAVIKKLPWETAVDTLILFDNGDPANGDQKSGDDIWTMLRNTGSEIANYFIDFYAFDCVSNKTAYYEGSFFSTIPFIKKNNILVIFDRREWPSNNQGFLSKPMDSASDSTKIADALHANGYDYDWWKVQFRGQPDSNTVSLYLENGIIVWATPDTSFLSKGVISDLSQNNLMAYLDNGGKLYITGQDISERVTYKGDSTNAFINYYLDANYGGDNLSGGLTMGELHFQVDRNHQTGGCDKIVDPSQSILSGFLGKKTNSEPTTLVTYDSDGSIGGQGVKVSSTSKTRYDIIYHGFSFEAIDTEEHRNAVMNEVIDKLKREKAIPLEDAEPPPGRNLIGYTAKDHIDITEGLMSIGGNYQRIRSFDPNGRQHGQNNNGALTYDPSLSEMSDLNFLYPGFGYWIYMSKKDSLIIPGPFLEKQSAIILEQGWNLIAYLPDNPDSVEHAFTSISGSYDVVRGFDMIGTTHGQGNDGALTYCTDPQLELFNDLNLLCPSFGYWIHMLIDDTLTYPVNSIFEGEWPSSKTLALKSNKYQRTRNNVITSSLWMDFYGEGSFKKGDTITVKVSDGEICGMTIVKEDNYFGFLHAYGDEAFTSDIDEGAEIGDTLKFYINNNLAAHTGKKPIVWKADKYPHKVTLNNISTDSHDSSEQIPLTHKIYQNFPNPFNPTTKIKFQLSVKENVSLNIYNILGQKVRTLVNKEMKAGYHSVLWDGLNENGEIAGSGIYIYQIQAGKYCKSLKLLLLR